MPDYVVVEHAGRLCHEHRLVAAELLGRALTPEETVHHINRNPADNRAENLFICTQEQHMRAHRQEFEC